MELGWGLSRILVVPLYITAILAVILTLTKRIEFGIFFILPFVPHQNILDYMIELPYGKDINDIIFVALIIKWIIDKRRSGESFIIRTPFNYAILAFMLWTYIEMWWGASYFGMDAPLSLKDPRVIYWKNLIRIPLLYLIIVNNIKSPKQMKVIVILMICAIIMLDRSFYNIAQYKDFSHFSESTDKIGGMEALGPNELAVFLAMYVIVLVALFTNIKNIWIKLMLSGPIALSYYCIAFLFSRSGYLAAFAGVAAIGLLKDKRIFILVFALVLYWQVLLPTAVRERIEMTRSDGKYDDTTQQRFGMWEKGLELVSSNPIMGIGLDGAHYVVVTSKGYDRSWGSFHNSYLQQSVETGIPGLVIYLWIFFLMFKAGWRLFRNTDDEFQKALGLGLMACVLSMLAGNFAGGYWNYFSMMGYLYVLTAMVMRIMINADEQENDSSLIGDNDINDSEKSYMPQSPITNTIEQLS